METFTNMLVHWMKKSKNSNFIRKQNYFTIAEEKFSILHRIQIVHEKFKILPYIKANTIGKQEDERKVLWNDELKT